MRYLNYTLAAPVLLAILSVGCEQADEATQPATESTAAVEQTAEPVMVSLANESCPIMGGKAKTTEDLTREFNGQTVGFCCDGCPQKWDKLSDDEKSAKLAEVQKKVDDGHDHEDHDHGV